MAVLTCMNVVLSHITKVMVIKDYKIVYISSMQRGILEVTVLCSELVNSDFTVTPWLS